MNILKSNQISIGDIIQVYSTDDDPQDEDLHVILNYENDYNVFNVFSLKNNVFDIWEADTYYKYWRFIKLA